MPSPADFVFNRAPTVGELPQANFDWLGNLSQAYYQGQQNALQSRFARLGMRQAEDYIGGGQQANAGPSDQSGAPQQQASVPTGGSDPRGKIPVIIEAAKKYGHDPRTMIRAAQSEGLAQFYGDNGRSGGAFQLYTKGGLGNEFQKETGLDPLDPKNEDATIDWMAKNLSRTGWGPYKGAAKVGIGNWDGISRGNQQVAGVSQPGTGSPAPVEQPKGAIGTAPFTASTSDNAGGPANIKLASSGTPDEFVGQPNRATSTSEVAANVQGDSGSSGSIGPAPNVQPSNRDVVAQGPSSTAGDERVGEAQPEQDPVIRRIDAQLKDKAAQMERAARASGNPFIGKGAQAVSERLAKEVEVLQQQRQERYSVLSKGIEQTRAAQIEREKQQYGVGISGQTKQQEADITQYSNLHKGLAGAGMTAANGMPYVQQAKALINSPQFYSGAASNADLAYKRVLAGLGIDPGGSLPQEAFRKVMAANILQQVNNLKAEQESMGQQGGRIFASQIELMEKAAQNPDNSIAANRYLTEVAERASNRSMKIADMADDYKQAHGRLDTGFEKNLRNWMVKNPMFTPAEMNNPQLIGAKPGTAAPSGGGQAGTANAGSFNEGQTATNKKTGERMIFKGGKWVPLI